MVGSTHVKVLPLIPQAKLVALCDAKPENAQTAMNKAEVKNVPIYTDLAEMLRKEQIDVIHLATPSGSHLEPALAAIEAGKNVICEKPLEIQLDRADQIIAAATKEQCPRRRHFPKSMEAREPRDPRCRRRGPLRQNRLGRAVSPRGIGRTSITRTAAGAGHGNTTAAGRS